MNKERVNQNKDFYKLINKDLYSEDFYKFIETNDIYNDLFLNYKDDMVEFTKFLSDKNLMNNLTKNPEILFDEFVDYKIKKLEKDIYDFKEKNRFFYVINDYLNNLKKPPNQNDNRSLTKNIITNIIAEQNIKLMNIYKDYENIMLEYNDLSRKKINYLDKKNDLLKQSNKKISTLYSNNSKIENLYLNIKNKIFTKLNLNKDEKLINLDNYNKFKKEMNLNVSKKIYLEENLRKKIKQNDLNDLNFNLEFKFEDKKQLKEILLQDKDFVSKCDFFDNQKIKLNSLTSYSKDLSEFFNNAIGDKADFIIQAISRHLQEVNNKIAEEQTISTKISEKLTKIDEGLRLKNLEGKTVVQIAEYYIKIGLVKKGIVMIATLALAHASLALNIHDFKYFKVDSQKMNLIISNMEKSKIGIKDINENNFDDFVKKINNLSEKQCVTLQNDLLNNQSSISKNITQVINKNNNEIDI